MARQPPKKKKKKKKKRELERRTEGEKKKQLFDFNFKAPSYSVTKVGNCTLSILQDKIRS